MNLKTTVKQPAPQDSTRFVSRYLHELIDYGGLAATRAEAILDMQEMGLTQGQIDRWLQGYDLGCRIRERHARRQAAEAAAVIVKVCLPPTKRRAKPQTRP